MLCGAALKEVLDGVSGGTDYLRHIYGLSSEALVKKAVEKLDGVSGELKASCLGGNRQYSGGKRRKNSRKCAGISDK